MRCRPRKGSAAGGPFPAGRFQGEDLLHQVLKPRGAIRHLEADLPDLAQPPPQTAQVFASVSRQASLSHFRKSPTVGRVGDRRISLLIIRTPLLEA